MRYDLLAIILAASVAVGCGTKPNSVEAESSAVTTPPKTQPCRKYPIAIGSKERLISECVRSVGPLRPQHDPDFKNVEVYETGVCRLRLHVAGDLVHAAEITLRLREGTRDNEPKEALQFVTLAQAVGDSVAPGWFQARGIDWLQEQNKQVPQHDVRTFCVEGYTRISFQGGPKSLEERLTFCRDYDWSERF